ncbi:MAG TPA: dihydrolipoyl dehydrogenase [Saprospirales bacterium]|nr:dihydrolipoyl dehydrogenase [Saprospirales bacterium]HAY70503.1 dihydrolipoyl dehydrogenase [Saprospirales bacterium]HRQ29010.1 dihydrolipoyl dehydrogenase [Saprospiraceae bacterium]
MSDNKQLVVIGAGPGGYTAAFLAADKGFEVTLIEKRLNPGGVCLYEGCIPSKALLHVAKLLEEAKHANDWGISFGKPTIDLDKLRSFKDSVIGKLTSGTGQLVKQRKINYIQGTASFEGDHTLSVTKTGGSVEKLSYSKVILATGSEVVRIPGLWLESDRMIDSAGALELRDIPEKMLVIGGGIIGLEMANVYSALGTKVSVVEMMPQLIPGADSDLINVLTRSIKPRLDKIMLETSVQQITETEKGLKVVFAGKKQGEDVYDKVLMAVGRRPVTKGLGLENTKVQIDERGFVKVNRAMQTDDPDIFAIGDIVGNPMLAHKASAEAKVAVQVISGKKAAFEPAGIPSVVYSDPEVAWVGLTEQYSAENGIEVEVQKFPWVASGRAVSMDRKDGVTKVLADPSTKRILGVGITGPGAGEMIAEATLAIEMAATVDDLSMTIHAHPTLSETVMETAEMFHGESTHIFKPKA